jgi:acetyltransferase-like isoleucine patch superfamily enzyme
MLSQLIFRCTDKFLELHQSYRSAKLMKSLCSCGVRVSISPDARIWGTDRVTLGDDVGINAFTHIFGGGGVHIGARTRISTGCSIASITHSEQIATRNHGIELPVTIEEDCWLGTGAIVLPGVRIGRGSIIGAGAVVTKDIPPLSLALGVPARVIRQITP